MFRITLKDIRLFLSDRRAVLMTFFMPIALISIFAMAYGGESERNARPVSLLVSDQDRSEKSKSVISQLDSIPGLELTVMPLDSAERLVKTGEESSVLLIGKGFADSIQSGKNMPLDLRYDELKAAEVGILQQALAGNIGRIIGLMRMAEIKQPALPDSVMQQMPAGMPPAKPAGAGLKMTPLLEEKQSSPGLIHAVAGTAVMMLLFGLTALGAGLLEEKENGTLKRLLYSPLEPTSILYGKVIASIIVAFLQLSVLFLYASFVFNLDLMKNLPSLLLMMFATSFACAGFGTFLASVAKSRQQVQMLSTLLVLSMSAIGGSMIPSFLMPAFMQKLSVISLNYWSIQGFYDIYWRNLEFTDTAFLMRPLMLFIIGTVMLLLGRMFFKKNVLRIS